ncbi:UNKNOWN [Stylonychia lemnae]|uniref:Uncharacterized protein n=1 Tax=Stylonychia lemnae TaxID=5949 RepID=A0A078AXK9_STYLE|nr:UNKNOWN [Stylonychia lemnae]|eukprot:CDW87200.1 UNKNOWN [Stylonychia lemnae]
MSQGTIYIKNFKQFEKLEMDLDSPTLRQAMINLGIPKEDLQKKTRENFAESGADDKVVDLRYKHYQNKMIQIINQLYQERKKVKEQQEPQINQRLINIASMSLASPLKGNRHSQILSATNQDSRSRSNNLALTEAYTDRGSVKRRGGIQQITGGLLSLQSAHGQLSMPYLKTERSTLMHSNISNNRRGSMLPKADFFNQLTTESAKVERMKERQEEITLKKLEKEATIRKRNEDLQKKWEKLEKFEVEYKREILAKSIVMSQKREQKIKEMKQMEREKERQLQKEQEKLMSHLHEKAINFTLLELERQREIRKREEEMDKKRQETQRRREMLQKEENDKLEGEELQRIALEEKIQKAHEKNEYFDKHVTQFKVEKEKQEQEKYGQLGMNLIKMDQRLKSFQDKLDMDKKQTQKKTTDQISKFKDNQKQEEEVEYYEFILNQDIRIKQQQIIKKMKIAERNLEQTKKEKDEEIRLKQELRRLKQEDLKQASDRLKRQENNKKLKIIEKEKEHEHQLQQMKIQKDLLLMAKQEQEKQLRDEKRAMDEAIIVIMNLNSKSAKEKYLKDNFDQNFIDKLKAKVPLILESEFRGKKRGKSSDINGNDQQE